MNKSEVMIDENLNFLCIYWMKPDGSFHTTQFFVPAFYSPHRLKSRCPLDNLRIVFRKQWNIYDVAFLQKLLTAFTRQLFSQENSTTDVPLGSRYTSGECLNQKTRTFPWFGCRYERSVNLFSFEKILIQIWSDILQLDFFV